MHGTKMTAMCPHPGRPVPISLGKTYGTEVKEAEKYWRAEAKKAKGVHHYKQWVEAAKANKPLDPGSNFDYSVPFTQAILIGCIALRFPGQEFIWDDNKKQFANHTEANKFLGFVPRKGFEYKS